MKFSSDPAMEALVGNVCLVFARVEQEAGQAVAAAHGNFAVAMSLDYLEYSASSGRLLDWLRAVGQAYPEAAADALSLVSNLRGLKQQRDQWAHSAAVIDLWLMMREKGLTSMTDRDIDHSRLLNGKQAGHINAPTQSDVDIFAARASDVGDAATALARKLDGLAESGIRTVVPPR